MTDALRDENARLREALGRLEARLRAREGGGFDLDAVFPAFPALLFLFSEDDRYLDYRAGEGLFAPPEAFLGRRIDEVLPPALGATFREAMARAREAGAVQSVEYSLPLAGEERHFEARLLALPDRRVVILATDVTERRNAEATVRRQEAQLGESQERFRELIEGSPDLLAVFDPAGRVAYASPSSQRLLGHPPERLLGRPASDMVVPEDVPRAMAILGELAASPGATRRIELRMARAGGGPLVFDALVRNLFHVPAVGGFVVNARDVTEERRLEAQVRQAQKLESVGRLAGGIAHDFNNLLIGILGYAELLEESVRAGRPSLEDLAEIRKAGERARDLTAQLLAVARRQVSEPRVVEVNDVLRDSEKLLRRVLGEDVDLSVQLEPRPWKVKVDPTSLQQVVLNLAVNARDAMPRGGKLTIETANVELDEQYALGHEGVSPGPHVLLAISDSGEGMSPEVQAHAFEPFFTTKAPGAGTGLGLATVYGIVKQAGGHVWLYSEPGRGTAFKIYLPRTDEAAEARPPRPPAPARRGSETILVVEDEAPVRALVVRVLEEAGYRVVPATGGQAALDLAAGHGGPIDLLLTDVVMPGLSGRQVADALAAARPGLRVLFTSGYTRNTIVHHGVLDPDVRFLAKPFTPSGLLERIRAVLDEA